MPDMSLEPLERLPELDLLLLGLQPSCPKLPLRISPIVGAFDVACAVAAKKPGGGSWCITRSSVKLIAEFDAEWTLCATLDAVFVRLLPFLNCVSVGEVGDAIEMVVAVNSCERDVAREDEQFKRYVSLRNGVRSGEFAKQETGWRRQVYWVSSWHCGPILRLCGNSRHKQDRQRSAA